MKARPFLLEGVATPSPPPRRVAAAVARPVRLTRTAPAPAGQGLSIMAEMISSHAACAWLAGTPAEAISADHPDCREALNSCRHRIDALLTNGGSTPAIPLVNCDSHSSGRATKTRHSSIISSQSLHVCSCWVSTVCSRTPSGADNIRFIMASSGANEGHTTTQYSALPRSCWGRSSGRTRLPGSRRGSWRR